MEVIELFGPALSALMVAGAIGYFLLSFAPVLWPALVARRAKPAMPRPVLFVAIVAALVYGAFSFLAFAVLIPIQAYGVFVAPTLADAGLTHGGWLVHVGSLAAEYWWLLIPPAQLALTWFVTRSLAGRWAYFCAAPPNNSSKPTPLRGAA